MAVSGEATSNWATSKIDSAIIGADFMVLCRMDIIFVRREKPEDVQGEWREQWRS